MGPRAPKPMLAYPTFRLSFREQTPLHSMLLPQIVGWLKSACKRYHVMRKLVRGPQRPDLFAALWPAAFNVLRTNRRLLVPKNYCMSLKTRGGDSSTRARSWALYSILRGMLGILHYHQLVSRVPGTETSPSRAELTSEPLIADTNSWQANKLWQTKGRL